MTYEQDIFKQYEVIEEKLIEYGFTRNHEKYQFSKEFMNFRADIMVYQGEVSGKVMDLEFDEEYVNFRIQNQVGEFVSKVRDEYESILMDIRTHCFKKMDFVYAQSNRISKRIQDMYHVRPEFLWTKFPRYGVYRNARSHKWFAIIMNITKEKLGLDSKDEVEIINVKLDDYVSLVLDKEGIYPSYHQSKKNWVSVLLDDTLTDDEIFALIQYSFSLSDVTRQWLIPANPKYYDVIYAFEYEDTILWKQSTSISTGDVIYLYVGAPYSAILYQCVVLESDIPYEYKDKNIKMKKAMRIQLIHRYKEDEFTFSFLKDFGVNAIRGPRSVPESLQKVLNEYKASNE